MATPSSQRRLTRSQARLAKDGSSVATTPAAPAASSKLPPNSESCSKMKSGRRVLADIASNDSPIVGCMVPAAMAKTPVSSNLKDLASRSRRCFDASSGSTPIGESLLRSQVQLLLQKVEADVHRAPALRTLCHINGFLDSPTRLAAPTPANTPASCVPVAPSGTPGTIQQESSLTPCLLNSEVPFTISPPVDDPGRHTQESGIKLFVNLAISPASQSEALSSSIVDNQPHDPRSGQLVISEPVSSGQDPQVMQITPLVSQVMDAETTESFLGKQTTRTLQFDSPDKNAATEISTPFFSNSSFSSADSPVPSVRELEDDETSEWSVLVNVSSPAGRHDEPDLMGDTPPVTDNVLSATACSLYEHLQKTREESNKLDLFWSERRRGTPYRRALKTEEEDDEEEEKQGEEEAYEECDEFYRSEGEEAGDQDEDEDEGEGWEDGETVTDCENLCTSFSGMRVEEGDGVVEMKGLPNAGGKHIRFLYDSDGEEIKEELLVKGETSGAMHLRGLPAPMGKHLRFCEAADEEESSVRSYSA